MKKQCLSIFLCSYFLLTGCNATTKEISFEEQNSENNDKIKQSIAPDNCEHEEEFYLETSIDKNTLIIQDNRSNLNGMKIIYSEAENIEESDKFKIKIISCENTPLKIPENTDRISDFFSVEAGTTDEVLITFPDELFRGYEQELKEGKIKLMEFVDSNYALDLPGSFWSGHILSTNNGITYYSTSYFKYAINLTSYYFIGVSK